MKKLILLIIFSFSCSDSYSSNVLYDSTKTQIGISGNFFTKSELPIGLELKLKNSPNNIFGIGVGYTIYYIRQLPKLQKNLIVGIPIILNRHDVSKTEVTPAIVQYNFIQAAPMVGIQFEIGKVQFLRLRATYSPIVFDWKKDKSNSIIDRHYFNQFGFGAALNFNK